MAQKIPFFELFPGLELSLEQRIALEGAYITSAEVERKKREMLIDLTVSKDLGEEKGHLERTIAISYALERVRIQQRVTELNSALGRKDSADEREVIMGGTIRGPVSSMVGLNPKMGGVIVAGRVFFSDLYETRRPGVFCLTFDITDFQSSVRVVKYMQKAEKDALKKEIKLGMWLKVQGYIKLNRDGTDILLDPRNITTYPREMRLDTATVKRVELHMHSSFSTK